MAAQASASRGLAAPLAPLVSPVYHPACSLAPAEALARGGGFAWGGGAHVGARSEQQDVLGVVWPGCARQTSAGGLALASLAGWPALTAGGKPAGVVTSFHVVCDGHGKHGRAVARFVTDQLGRALRDAARVLGAGASAEAAFEAAFLALDAELLAADAWLRAGAAAEPREGDAPAAADLAAGERAARELTRLASAAGQRALAPRADCGCADRAHAWRKRLPSQRRGHASARACAAAASAQGLPPSGDESAASGGASPASPAGARATVAPRSASSPRSPDGPDWDAGPVEWGGEQVDDGLSAPSSSSSSDEDVEGEGGGASSGGESADSEAEFQAARARAATREDARRGLGGGGGRGARRAGGGGLSAAICAESGCTVIAALVLELADGTRRAVVASAGDCRALHYAVPAGGGPAVARSLVAAHTPLVPSELARIERAGGWATVDGRVSGLLRASRALGDSAFKRVAGRSLREQPVTALPDSALVDLPRVVALDAAAAAAGDQGFALLLLVSDGVSDVLSDAQVLAYTRARAHARRSLPRIAAGLARACACADRPCAGDNATVVIGAWGDLGADCELSTSLPAQSGQSSRRLDLGREAESARQP